MAESLGRWLDQDQLLDRWWENTQHPLPVQFQWKSSSAISVDEDDGIEYSRSYIMMFLGLDEEKLVGERFYFGRLEELHITLLFCDTYGKAWNEWTSALCKDLACIACHLLEFLVDPAEEFYLWQGPWKAESWSYQPLKYYTTPLMKLRLALQAMARQQGLPDWTMAHRSIHISWH